MANTTVYRVVRVMDRQYWSYAAGQWDITYRAHVWQAGLDDTPVFAFQYKKHALLFAQEARAWCQSEVWEAEAQNVRKAPPITGLSCEWAKFWLGESTAECVEPPAGTVIADKLRLLKRVWPEAK